MPLCLYPSLDTDGWLSSPTDVADKLMSDFFDSNYSQTDIYLGNVSSFGYIMQVTKGDLNACKSKIEETLKSYFLRYFSNVTIEVTTESVNPTSSKAELGIYMTFTDTDGKMYNLGKLVQLEGTKVNKIIKLNNEGIRI